MSREIATLARHRLERARAALHAARALLATRGVDSARHSGVITLFQQHFVKTGLMQTDVSRSFHRAFEKRLNTDYADFSEITPEDATEVRASVNQFVDACAELLERLLRETVAPRGESPEP